MRIIGIMFLSVLIGCSSKGEDDKLNAKSIAIHNSMVMKAKEIENELLLLKSDSISIVKNDSIDVLLFTLEGWENDLVEIPGNEGHQHLGHHHDHSNKAPEITAVQMLQIQQELDKRLEIISTRASDLRNNPQE